MASLAAFSSQRETIYLFFFTHSKIAWKLGPDGHFEGNRRCDSDWPIKTQPDVSSVWLFGGRVGGWGGSSVWSQDWFNFARVGLWLQLPRLSGTIWALTRTQPATQLNTTPQQSLFCWHFDAPCHTTERRWDLIWIPFIYLFIWQKTKNWMNMLIRPASLLCSTDSGKSHTCKKIRRFSAEPAAESSSNMVAPTKVGRFWFNGESFPCSLCVKVPNWSQAVSLIQRWKICMLRTEAEDSGDELLSWISNAKKFNNINIYVPPPKSHSITMRKCGD